MFGKDDEINVQSVHKKLNEIMAARGKKGTDRKEQIELLHELMNVSDENNLGPAIRIKIQFNIIMSIYDYNPSVSDPMKVELWDKVGSGDCAMDNAALIPYPQWIQMIDKYVLIFSGEKDIYFFLYILLASWLWDNEMIIWFTKTEERWLTQ